MTVEPIMPEDEKALYRHYLVRGITPETFAAEVLALPTIPPLGSPHPLASDNPTFAHRVAGFKTVGGESEGTAIVTLYFEQPPKVAV